MTAQILTARTLPEIAQGLLEHQINDGLAQIFGDLEERPNLTKARALQITLRFKPAASDRNIDNGVEIDRVHDLSAASIAFEVKLTLPPSAFQRKMTIAKKNRGFAFETDTNSTAHHPDQPTFEYSDDPES